MKHNERNAGRKKVIDGKQRRITCTPEEHAEITKLLLEIRKKSKEDEK